MSPSDLSLQDLQKWLRWIITDPRGATEALSDPTPEVDRFRSRYTRPGGDGLASICETGNLTRLERLDVYAEGYFSRIVESMSADFWTVRRITGETAFLKLTADYLKVHPSQCTNIGEIGARLPGFLREHELAREVACLPDLAQLEWNVIESFYADNVPSFDFSALREVSDSAWAGAVFGLDPSVRLLKFAWRVGELWRKRNSADFDSVLERAGPSEAFFVLHRVDGEVYLDDLHPNQYLVLSLMAQGRSLGRICSQLDERSPLETRDSLPSAVPIMQWFGDWLKSGLIKTIEFGGGK